MREDAANCLIITNQFPPLVGGAAEVYAALARSAAPRIVILCASHDYRSGQEVPGWREHDAAAPYPIHRIPRIRPFLHQTDIRNDLSVRAELLTTLWRLRRRYRFQAVCIADDETVGWLIKPAQLMGCRVLLYTHGDDLAEKPNEQHLRARRRRQFARTDRILAVSAASAAELCRVFGVDSARVTVLPNGVDLDRFRPVPPDENLRQRLGLAGKRVIVTVSRLLARKGIDHMIEALPLVTSAVPDAHYLVIGDGPQEPELHALTSRFGVTDRVTFLGAVPQPDIPRYLALSELFAMPNRRLENGEEDGFGLVFLEANACGLPVIGGRAGGVPEVITHEVNGLLVDGLSVQAIADATIRLLTDKELAARLAANGLRRALESGWSSRAENFLNLALGPFRESGNQGQSDDASPTG